jgi:hypothetical protein
VYRTWAEKWAEEQLRGRRREDLAERRRKARRKREAERVEAYAPTPRKRAVSGELVEDAVRAGVGGVGRVVSTVWRRGD